MVKYKFYLNKKSQARNIIYEVKQIYKTGECNNNKLNLKISLNRLNNKMEMTEDKVREL